MKEVKDRAALSLVRFQPESKEIFYFGGMESVEDAETPCWLTSPDRAIRFQGTGDVAAIAHQLKCECWTFFDAKQDVPEDMEILLESAVTMMQQHKVLVLEANSQPQEEKILRDDQGKPFLRIATRSPGYY